MCLNINWASAPCADTQQRLALTGWASTGDAGEQPLLAGAGACSGACWRGGRVADALLLLSTWRDQPVELAIGSHLLPCTDACLWSTVPQDSDIQLPLLLQHMGRVCKQVQPRLAQGGLGAECGMQRSIRRPRKPELDWLPVGDAVAGAPECGAVGWDCCGAAVHSVHAALRDVGQGRCILSSPAYDVRARGMSSASIVWKLVKTWHWPYVPSSKLTEGMRASPRRSLHAVQIESRHRLLNTWTHGTVVRLCCSLHRDLPSMYA